LQLPYGELLYASSQLPFGTLYSSLQLPYGELLYMHRCTAIWYSLFIVTTAIAFRTQFHHCTLLSSVAATICCYDGSSSIYGRLYPSLQLQRMLLLNALLSAILRRPELVLLHPSLHLLRMLLLLNDAIFIVLAILYFSIHSRDSTTFLAIMDMDDYLLDTFYLQVFFFGEREGRPSLFHPVIVIQLVDNIIPSGWLAG